MSITQILLLILLAFICGQIKHPRYRNILLLISGLLIYYRFQPASSILNLDYWLPTSAIGLGMLVWIATQSNFIRAVRENFFIILIVLLVTVAVSANRYLALCCITSTRPPHVWIILLFLSIMLPLSAFISTRIPYRQRLSYLILFIVILFVFLKLPEGSLLMSKFLRILNHQDTRFSSANDVVWLGISYILFRMLHLLLDVRAERLFPASLIETINYLFFFPALSAGPIARFPQFRGELDRHPQGVDIITGLQRIFSGLFRKFVLADTLALISLSPNNAFQINSALYLWIALIGYSLRIYFDFSGYTDIAIGSSLLMGIRLPENFNAPYLKTSLIQFWNSWHITLADWFRSYTFNPLTRKLRATSQLNWLTVLIPQISTMLLIGLWHGITPNFLIWGAWHGIGLFINNRWNGWVKTHPLNISPSLQNFFGWALTFGYVCLGWVWFLMPTISGSIAIFRNLFGFGG